MKCQIHHCNLSIALMLIQGWQFRVVNHVKVYDFLLSISSLIEVPDLLWIPSQLDMKIIGSCFSFFLLTGGSFYQENSNLTDSKLSKSSLSVDVPSSKCYLTCMCFSR